jgi:hypothetical protein
VAKKKIARRRRPFDPETDSLNVRVTAKDIAAAQRAGLSGAQLIHRAVRKDRVRLEGDGDEGTHRDLADASPMSR